MPNDPLQRLAAEGDVADFGVMVNPPGQPIAVCAAGEVDLDTASAFLFSLYQATNECLSGRVAVDLSMCTFLGAAGLTALTEARRFAHLRSREIVLVEPSPEVLATLRLSGRANDFVVLAGL